MTIKGLGGFVPVAQVCNLRCGRHAGAGQNPEWGTSPRATLHLGTTPRWGHLHEFASHRPVLMPTGISLCHPGVKMRRKRANDNGLALLIPKEVQTKTVSLIAGVPLLEMSVQCLPATSILNDICIAFFLITSAREGCTFFNAEILARINKLLTTCPTSHRYIIVPKH